MKKLQFSFLFSLCVLIILMASCKKENNRIANVTYELDSVKMEKLDANDSLTFTLTIPISNDIIDSLYKYGGFVSEFGDSLNVRKYLPPRYICCAGYYLSEHGIILHNKPVMDTFNEDLGAHTNVYCATKYSYSTDNKLDYINLDYLKTFAIYSEIDKIYCKYNYIGNSLYSITNKILYTSNHNSNQGFDTLQNSTNTNNYSYTNSINNQKDLIGIDLNDLFLNAQITNQYQITPISYLNLYAPFLILNSKMSYNTKSDKLIEGVQIDILNYNLNSFIETANYTFDSSKNNRVSTMKITTTTTTIFDAIKTSTLFTFYYKN